MNFLRDDLRPERMARINTPPMLLCRVREKRRAHAHIFQHRVTLAIDIILSPLLLCLIHAITSRQWVKMVAMLICHCGGRAAISLGFAMKKAAARD